MRRALIVLAVLLVLVVGVSIVVIAARSGSGVEVEDCDPEDYANREAECGFAPTPKASKSARATPSPTRKK